MRFNFIKLLLLFVLPLFAYAQGIEVKDSLASMVEEVVDKAGIKSINISPNNMTPTSININRIDGVGICEPAIKSKVEKLVKLFSQHRNIRNVISSYGVYVKKENGAVSYMPSTAAEIEHLIGDCKNLYVSVY